jgi:hypothetical protein
VLALSLDVCAEDVLARGPDRRAGECRDGSEQQGSSNDLESPHER